MLDGKRKRKLEEENKLLEDQLERIKRKHLVGNKIQELGYGSTRTGYYSDLDLLPDYKTKWKNSFFELHQDIAEEHTKGNLSSRILAINREFVKYDYSGQNSYRYMPFVVHCRGVIPSEDGPMLCLEDPFGSIVSRPLRHTSLEITNSWINRILIAYIGIHYENEDYPINRVKTLKFDLYDKAKYKDERNTL